MWYRLFEGSGWVVLVQVVMQSWLVMLSVSKLAEVAWHGVDWDIIQVAKWQERKWVGDMVLVRGIGTSHLQVDMVLGDRSVVRTKWKSVGSDM